MSGAIDGEEGRVLFVVLNPKLRTKPSNQLLEAMVSDRRVQVMMNQSLDATVAEIQKRGRAMVYYEVMEREDLVPLMAIIKQFNPHIRASLVKVFGILDFEVDKVTPFLNKNQSPDIMPPTVQAKAVAHKVARFIEIVKKASSSKLKAIQDAQQGTKGQDARRFTKSNPASAQKAVEQAKPRVEWLSSISERCDFFVLRKTSSIKKVLKRWVVTLVGPPASLGNWERIKSAGQSSREAYVWRPHKDFHRFQSEPGEWIFYGKRPEYSSKFSEWMFVGENPRLVFERPQGLSLTKLVGEGFELKIARNPGYTQTLLADINEVLNQEFVFTKEGGVKTRTRKDSDEVVDAQALEAPDLTPDADLLPPGTEGSSQAVGAASNSGGFYVTNDSDSASSSEAEDYIDAAEQNAESAEGTDWSQVLSDVGLRMALKLSLSGSAFGVKLMDFFDDEITVQVTQEVSDRGDKAWLGVEMTRIDPSLRAEIEVDLLEVEEGALSGSSLLTLRVPRDKLSVLAPFMKVFEARQGNVSEFLSKAKGE